jgi:hypothetical protein
MESAADIQEKPYAYVLNTKDISLSGKQLINSIEYFPIDEVFKAERIELIRTLNPVEKLNISLRNKFEKQININKVYFENIDTEQLRYWVFATIQKIADLQPNGVSLEVTSDKSVLFTAICPNFNLYLDLFFENEINEFVEVVINATKDKKTVFSIGGKFNYAIGEFKEFCK